MGHITVITGHGVKGKRLENCLPRRARRARRVEGKGQKNCSPRRVFLDRMYRMFQDVMIKQQDFVSLFYPVNRQMDGLPPIPTVVGLDFKGFFRGVV